MLVGWLAGGCPAGQLANYFLESIWGTAGPGNHVVVETLSLTLHFISLHLLFPSDGASESGWAAGGGIIMSLLRFPDTSAPILTALTSGAVGSGEQL